MKIQNEANLNETIELPWSMSSRSIYKFAGFVICVGCFCFVLSPIFKIEKFSLEYFFILFVGLLTFLSTFRAVKCSVDGITLTKYFIFPKTSSWENIQMVQMGRYMFRGRGGTPSQPQHYLAIRTKSYKSLLMYFYWFRKRDLEILIKILRSKPIPFSKSEAKSIG